MWEMKQYLLLFNAAQNVQHVIPYHLDGRNQKSLVWSVDIAKSRTEAYHVEVWVTLREWLAPFWLVLLEGDNMSQRLVHIECLCELLLFAILVGQLISGPYI